jgi:hypothetical protein
MRAGSLSRHLADLHKIYQGQVVAGELLDRCEGVVYKVKEGHGKLKCLFPLCTGELASGWMMRKHFHDLHPLDYVTVPREGQYPWCPCCGMQVDPQYLAHINERVPGGDGETPPVGHGSAISACFVQAIHGSRGRTGKG